MRAVEQLVPHRQRLVAIGERDDLRRGDRQQHHAQADQLAAVDRGQRQLRALGGRAAVGRPMVRGDRREQLRRCARASGSRRCGEALVGDRGTTPKDAALSSTASRPARSISASGGRSAAARRATSIPRAGPP